MNIMGYYFKTNPAVFLQRNRKKNDLELIGAWKTVALLKLHSNLEYFKLNPTSGDAYLYDASKGVYEKLDKKQLRGKISSILGFSARLEPKLRDDISNFKTELAILRLQGLENPSYINKIITAFESIEKCTFYGSPEFNSDVTVFKNGVLDLKTKVLMPWSPRLLCRLITILKLHVKTLDPILTSYVKRRTTEKCF